MICSITNVSTVALLVDFSDGSEHMLQPQEYVLYDDYFQVATKPTWELVEMGLLVDRDVEQWLPKNLEPLHNWLVEGF